MENTDAFLIGVIIVLIVGYNAFVSPNFSVMRVVTTLWRVLSWIITLHEIYTWLYFLLHTTLHSLSLMDLITTLWAIVSWIVTIHELLTCLCFLLHSLSTTRNIIGDTNNPDIAIGVLLEELDVTREAFGVFDENCDGFIDANELEKVVCAFGYSDVSQEKCQRMIRAFDENGDGKIDLGEFVKVLQNNSWENMLDINS